MSLTRRLVRTSTRRTLSRSSEMVMTASGRSPKLETRSPKEIRMPKSETRKGGDWHSSAHCRVRPSDFGLPSAFGSRTSDFASWHRHGVEYLLDDGIRRHRLRLGFVGEDNPVPQHIGTD